MIFGGPDSAVKSALEFNLLDSVFMLIERLEEGKTLEIHKPGKWSSSRVVKVVAMSSMVGPRGETNQSERRDFVPATVDMYSRDCSDL